MHQLNFGLFIALIVSMSLVIGCGCVINNYIDRGIDVRMKRTSKRALVTEQISAKAALSYGVLLGVLGFTLLTIFTNLITTIIGAIGLFFYLVMYSIFKRLSPIGTVVGSVSGATPIAAGYTAVTGRFDAAALILFLSMVFWQMPHFYAIAMYRRDDYKSAGVPVLAVVRGMRLSKFYIMAYTAAFTVAAASLTLFGHAHYIYLAIVLVLGLSWLYRGVTGFNVRDDIGWGKQMFLFSLVSLLVFCGAVAIGAWLP